MRSSARTKISANVMGELGAFSIVQVLSCVRHQILPSIGVTLHQ
jgi:hypothetical protein